MWISLMLVVSRGVAWLARKTSSAGRPKRDRVCGEHSGTWEPRDRTCGGPTSTTVRRGWTSEPPCDTPRRAALWS